MGGIRELIYMGQQTIGIGYRSLTDNNDLD